MIKKSKTAINFGAAIIVAVVVICIAVTATVLARPLYYFDIEFLNIAENSGYSKDACRLNYDTLIDYNLLGGEEELIFPTLPMSEEGRIHFEEVKKIFISMQIVSIVGIIGFIVFAYVIKRNQKAVKEKNIIWMKYTGYVCILIAIAVCMAMFINWQWAFTMMHNIFFDNDYWLFNPYTDPVIKILPDEFFFHCGALIILLVVLQVVALRLCYNRLTTIKKVGEIKC